MTTVLQRYLAGLIPWALVPNLPSVMDVTELSRLLPGGILGLHVGWAANADPSLSQAQLKAALKPGNARYALWGAVQQQLNADGPWIGLVNPVAVLASTKDLSGVAFNPTWTVDFASVTPVEGVSTNDARRGGHSPSPAPDDPYPRKSRTSTTAFASSPSGASGHR